MIELQNSELRIELLDPISERARLGPRFCGGGFIWQVYDAFDRPLLSGPEWPSPVPTPFNGQGLPESFRHRTLDAQPLTWQGERGVALGAGELCVDASGQVRLATPCNWEISHQPNSVEFSTAQRVGRFHYALVRRVELKGRNVQSRTRLTNLSSSEPLILEWFAHPFFPLVDGRVQAEIATSATLPENPGFSLQHGRLTQKRRFNSATDGHMDRGLRLPAHQTLQAKLAHPSLDYITLATSFVPSACVIWGNDRTFSFEPYLTLNLAPGESREWSLDYDFGVSSGMPTPGATSRIIPSR
jgi:hypothetical protein